MRVLIVSQCFPPDPEVGSLRAAKVCEALAGARHEVHVVTARLPGEVGAIRVAGARITVHTVSAIPHPRKVYLLAKKWFGRNGTSPGPEAAALGAEGRTPAWKRYLLSLLWLPDEHHGFILPALWSCWRIYRRARIDLLYTTAPPFSTHLAGMLFNWMTGLPWAAEFRDPWSDNSKPASFRSRVSDAVERRLERWCLTRADYVVSATDAIHQLLAQKVRPGPHRRFVVARNGIDRLTAPRRSTSAPGCLRIVHAGSLYHGRDPRPFFHALADLRRKGKLEEHEVRVDFVGDDRWFGGVSLEQVVQDLGLTSMVQFRGWLPHDACLELLEQAHVLLLLAQDQPAQVPNKLFEYLGARKPILAFADAHGEVAHMLNRVGGHYLVTPGDPSRAEQALEAALCDARAGTGGHTDEQVLREWTTEQQMRRLLVALQA